MFLLEVRVQLLDRLDPRDGSVFVDYIFTNATPSVDSDEWFHIYRVIQMAVQNTLSTDKFLIISLQFKPQ